MNMTPEQDAWLFLTHVPNLGSLRFFRLLSFAGTAERILQMRAQDLTCAGVTLEMAQEWRRAFGNSALRRRADDEVARADRGEFRIVNAADPDYPAPLRTIIGRPPVLYVKGRWPLGAHPGVAVVGTRNAT